ncbi:MAG: sensor histidine kinase [Alkalinema sp. FL-bin-369]|nr:sensor histidine kinase [Leptolyngbyaceae cyanobacterium LF-bin-369]
MITPNHHPFRFLLQFEWGLLVLTALGELMRLPPLRLLTIGIPREPGLNIAIIVMIGLLGLRLPTEHRRQKWLYTGMLASLIAIAILGTGMQLFPLLCVVFVMRTGLMFGTGVHRWLTGLTFVSTGSAQLYHALTVQYTRWEQIAMRRAERGTVRSPFRVEGAPDIQDFLASRLWMMSLSSVILLGLVLLFVQVLISALVAERQSREALTAANQTLRIYALRVEDLAIVQERDRISREIHDSLGHSLTVFNLYLEAGLRLWDSDPVEAKDLIGEAKTQGSMALQSVRHSVSNLRSSPLSNKSLSELIETLLQDWQRSTQIKPTTDIQILLTLPESLKLTLYRILQETLTNITKYAQATEVDIVVRTMVQSNQDWIQLRVCDNGIGFVRSQTKSGFGLQGMQERAIANGGILTVETSLNAGCTIEVRIPV